MADEPKRANLATAAPDPLATGDVSLAAFIARVDREARKTRAARELHAAQEALFDSDAYLVAPGRLGLSPGSSLATPNELTAVDTTGSLFDDIAPTINKGAGEKAWPLLSDSVWDEQPGVMIDMEPADAAPPVLRAATRSAWPPIGYAAATDQLPATATRSAVAPQPATVPRPAPAARPDVADLPPTSQDIDSILLSLLGDASQSDGATRQGVPAAGRVNGCGPVVATAAATPVAAAPSATPTADGAPAPAAPAPAPDPAAAADPPPSIPGIGWSEYYSGQDDFDIDDDILAMPGSRAWIRDIDEDWLDDEADYYDEYDEFGYEDGQPQPTLIWPLVLTALAVVIVLTGGLTLYIRTMQVNIDNAAIQQRGQAVATLNESIAFIQEADLVVTAIDKALDTPVTPESLDELAALIDQVDRAQQTLDLAMSRANEAKSQFADQADQAIAQYAYDAALYRKQMLLLGVQLIQADISAMQCMVGLNEAIDDIIEADALMRSAASSMSAGGANQASDSLRMNREACEKLDTAHQLLLDAQSSFPEADFTALVAYVVAKRESCELAMASDQAVLDRDYATATARNDEFLAKDAEVVELAMLLPETPVSIIFEAYDAKTSEWHTEYSQLFNQAADTDVYLRAWLRNRGLADCLADTAKLFTDSQR